MKPLLNEENRLALVWFCEQLRELEEKNGFGRIVVEVEYGRSDFLECSNKALVSKLVKKGGD